MKNSFEQGVRAVFCVQTVINPVVTASGEKYYDQDVAR